MIQRTTALSKTSVTSAAEGVRRPPFASPHVGAANLRETSGAFGAPRN
jgi:hypothetical protein